MFQRIDGDWWNSRRRVPDKFLVLKRNYDLQENRLPTPVPFETMPPYRLTMPSQVAGFRLRDLGELQIYPGHDMQALPAPEQYYGAAAFQGLADRAREADKPSWRALKSNVEAQGEALSRRVSGSRPSRRRCRPSARSFPPSGRERPARASGYQKSASSASSRRSAASIAMAKRR